MADNSWWNSVSTGFSNFADGIGDLFNVGSTVSPSSNIKPDDILKTKSALNAVGSYKVPEFGITDIPDTGMIDGLKAFQANNGLKVDGVMKPGGPTENALGQTLAKQGISTSDLLAKAKVPTITPKPDVPKPASTPPQTSWLASVPFGETPKSSKPKLPKIDPMTGLSDPLANAPKGKMPTQKQWEEIAKMQQQKASSAIIPQGDTVDQRIRSMMTDKRYGDKLDTPLRDHVQRQFQTAYPGKVKYDETGKMIQPTAAIRPQDVQPFDPDGELSNVSTETSKSEPIIMENVTLETWPVMAANMVELDGDKGSSDQPEPYLRPNMGDVDPAKAYKELGYDLNGKSEWYHAITSPIDAGKAKQLIDDVESETAALFGKNGLNDKSDAFRHAYGAYMMAMKFGVDKSKAFTDAHETDAIGSGYGSPTGGVGESLMDLYNNKIGRDLFLKYGKSGRDPKEIIQEALRSGMLQTRPFKIRPSK
ncbi:peptidoglycan-binding domain-containing protein [Terasakiella pusilla]|uniref:peptidoglycan-binding domain-containing protein n=1 Tax=Terasakiella pusilla TaxID=64973 RepID=UPI003AA866D7